MIIYEFERTSLAGKLFEIHEIEVEEKPKTYIGKYTRISKDDIGKLSSHYGNRMYSLSNDPKPYIEAIKELIAKKIKLYEKWLADENESLAKWTALAERIGE